MALPKIQITPVGIGAVADDGTGTKLRFAFENLNSSIASLAQVLEAIKAEADPELDTFRKVADLIYVWNTIINGLPTPQQVIDLIEAEAAPVIAAIPTPAQVAAMITAAAADVVAELSPTNFYTKTATDALLAAQRALIDANTASAAAIADASVRRDFYGSFWGTR